MGTSFADKAWGRESAVYRVTGVLTVVGGWFMTAVIAFTFAGLFATVIFYGGGFGVLLLVAFAVYMIWSTHRKHRSREEDTQKGEVFNLEEVQDPRECIETTFKHMSFLLKEIHQSLDNALDGLFRQDFDTIGVERKRLAKTQRWSNIIIANVFKAMRLLDQKGVAISHRYPQTIRRLQKLSDGHRDIVLRAYTHIGNHHKGLLPEQIEELKQVREKLGVILSEVESTFDRMQTSDIEKLRQLDEDLRAYAGELNEHQVPRIKDVTSKTRLSILYYGIVGNAMMLSKQNLELLEIFDESFGQVEDSLRSKD